jgi:hypothetical protein
MRTVWTISPRSGRRAGEVYYNLKMDFAADSLQIAQWEIFDAIVDCTHAVGGGA